MPRGRRRRQGPRIPIRAAANYANAHPWQMDQASPGVAYTPLVDPWIERPCCGDPVCVRTTMEQKSTASDSVGNKPTERGLPAARMPGPRPLRMDFHWVPGSDPGTFDGSPWLLDRFLAQLGDYMSFRFEHYQDNLSRVCEILGRLTGRARAWAAPYLDGDLPLPDDYEVFCQDLEEVIQDPNNFAEYHAAVPCPLPPASSQPPVAPQLPVVREYLARFSETLALNMGTTPGPVSAAVATPVVSRPHSTSRNVLGKESTPGPQEVPALSSSACSPDPGPVGLGVFQPEEADPTPVPILLKSPNLPVQMTNIAHPKGSGTQKIEEEVSETEGVQDVRLGASQGVMETPEEPPFSPVYQHASMDSEHSPGDYALPSMAAPLAPPPPDPQFVLRGTQSAVNALHFCGGTQAQGCPLLFSGSQSGLVHIWSLQTRRAVTTLDGHGGQSVIWLRTLPQGPQLLSQGRDLQLCLWDLAEGRNTIVDSVHLESVGFCRSSILVEEQLHWMLAVPGKDSDEVQILEMPSKTSVCTLKPEADAKPGMPMCLGLWQADTSPRPLLLVGYEDGSVALWDILERKVCSRVACHGEPVMGLDFDSRKARGISGSAGKALAVWSLDGQQALQVRHTHELTNPGIADIMIRPDRKILATAGWDHRIRIFHWRTMKPLAVLAFHSASVHCVTFSDDGLLAAGSKDQRISIWSLYPHT